MKRIIRLTESDLARIVRRVIMEQPDKPTDERFQFNLDYFEKNPRGVIKMESNKTFPSILNINNVEVKNLSDFIDRWRAGGTDFGRGFSTGNGMFNYEWDGSQLNIVGGPGNENNCGPNDECYYTPK